MSKSTDSPLPLNKCGSKVLTRVSLSLTPGRSTSFVVHKKNERDEKIGGNTQFQSFPTGQRDHKLFITLK